MTRRGGHEKKPTISTTEDWKLIWVRNIIILCLGLSTLAMILHALFSVGLTPHEESITKKLNSYNISTEYDESNNWFCDSNLENHCYNQMEKHGVWDLLQMPRLTSTTGICLVFSECKEGADSCDEVIINGSIIPNQLTRNRPAIILSNQADPSANFTLLMIDLHALKTNNGDIIIRWMRINVNNQNKGTDLVKYEIPTQLGAPGIHHYVILYYQQPIKEDFLIRFKDNSWINDPKMWAADHDLRLAGACFFSSQFIA